MGLTLASLFAISTLLVSSPPAFASHPSPPSGFHYEADYDHVSDRIILFSGWAAEFVDETWTYDFNTNSWARKAPPVQPSQRFGPGLAFDGGSDRTVLFGGQAEYPCLSGCTYSNETWAYDDAGDIWVQVSLAQGPSPRSVVDMAYDAQSDRIILFGGKSDFVLGSTWAYDFDTDMWTNLAPASVPPARFAHSMAYDSESDRIILFGGLRDPFDTSTQLADTWAYDYETNTWTSRATGPAARFEGRMAYDAKSDQIILFGGEREGSEHLKDTWAYDFNNDVWTQMDPLAHPSGGTSGAMAYDAESNRVILFGGQTGLGPATDATWAYDFNTNTWSLMTHPGPPGDLQASSGDELVVLSWEIPLLDYEQPIVAYRVYRGTSSGDVSLLVEVSGVQSYSDADVANGVTYYYQVSAVNEAGEGPRSAEESAMPTDMTDPTVTITSPQDGATVTNTTVAVTGSASDNEALEKVELSTDGVNWEVATGTTSWSGTLVLIDGANTITARATDTSGNTATEAVSVTLSPEPEPPPDGIVPLLLLFGGIAAAAGAIGIIALVLRRRGKRQ